MLLQKRQPVKLWVHMHTHSPSWYSSQFSLFDCICNAPPHCSAAEALDTGDAAAALAELKAFQREDFVGIFTAMDGLPGGWLQSVVCWWEGDLT